MPFSIILLNCSTIYTVVEFRNVGHTLGLPSFKISVAFPLNKFSQHLLNFSFLRGWKAENHISKPSMKIVFFYYELSFTNYMHFCEICKENTALDIFMWPWQFLLIKFGNVIISYSIDK